MIRTDQSPSLFKDDHNTSESTPQFQLVSRFDNNKELAAGSSGNNNGNGGGVSKKNIFDELQSAIKIYEQHEGDEDEEEEEGS